MLTRIQDFNKIFFLLCAVFTFQSSYIEAALENVQDLIAFGNLDSPIEVYYFSDWECSTCRRIEPIIAENAVEIAKSARFIFVDYINNQESIDFTPYNLSFMIRNKSQYLQLRGALEQLSQQTKTPKDSEILEAISRVGGSYQPLSYSEVTAGIKYFKRLAQQFHVDRTPTVIVVNSQKHIGKKFVGSDEISGKAILSAIESLKQGS